jgi:hypothetical protein
LKIDKIGHYARNSAIKGLIPKSCRRLEISYGICFGNARVKGYMYTSFENLHEDLQVVFNKPKSTSSGASINWFLNSK